MQKERILISGITGYLGSRTGLIALKNNQGKYLLRGMYRNEAKRDEIKRVYGEELASQIEFVKADLNDHDSLGMAM